MLPSPSSDDDDDLEYFDAPDLDPKLFPTFALYLPSKGKYAGWL